MMCNLLLFNKFAWTKKEESDEKEGNL